MKRVRNKPTIFIVSKPPLLFSVPEGDIRLSVRSIDTDIYRVTFSSSKAINFPAIENGTLIKFIQWGTNKWASLEDAFSNQYADFYKAKDVPDLSECKSLQRMFYNCSKFNQDISNWDVSNVENMSLMFGGCVSFNQDISKWNMSAVRITDHMFYNCRLFNQDISSWDVSSVTSARFMFQNCTVFNQDLSKWDVAKMLGVGIFAGCASLTKNPNWDRSWCGMFDKCPAKFT